MYVGTRTSDMQIPLILLDKVIEITIPMSKYADKDITYPNATRRIFEARMA